MRGKQAPKRKIKGDSQYNDVQIAKFINYVMRNGKKSIAEKIVYGCFDIIKEKTKQDPRHIFSKALKQVMPLLEVRTRKIGGVHYQIPYQVKSERRFTLGCKWIIEAARKSKGKSMKEKLANEIFAAINNEGAAIKKKEDVYKMAVANKAFAHFAK